MAILQAQISNELNKDQEIHWFFNIVNSDEGTWTSDITDHYVEDGTTVQDNIVIQPVEFTISGLIGEQVFKDELPDVTSQISNTLSKLKPIAALAPIVSNYSKAVVNASYYVENEVNKIKNVVDSIKDKTFFKDATQKSKWQTTVAEKLAQMQQSRTLCTLDCDLGNFRNMAIKSIRIKQEDTTMQSDLVVELKQIRFVETYLTAADAKAYGDRSAQQRETVENLGRVQGNRISTLRSWVSPTIVPYFTGLQ